ncbi:MAG: hypothetical protein IPM82_32020 [Saprospiraceae bacterium]|nr:hypothetical protein [Saprospiraceae bacterium]
MNQISVLILSIIVTMLACKQGKLASETTFYQPTVAEQAAPNDEDYLNSKSIKQGWLEESDKRLKRWYVFHEKSILNFNHKDFVIVDTFHDVEFIQLDIAKLDPALAKYRFNSPNSKKQLDIYGYDRQLLSGKNGQLELVSQSLDCEVALYGSTTSQKTRLLFCGGSCQFEDAVWIDDDRLIVAGSSSEVDKKSHPMLWGVKLSTRSVYRFMHPAEVTVEPKSFFNTVVFSSR